MRVDTLVVGQGLAGSLVARRLAGRGTVAVVDPGEPNATGVAAGLMTPLTGRKFRLTPEFPVLFDRAREVYSQLGVFRPISVYRMFADADQRASGLARATEPDCAPFIERVVDGVGQLDASLADPFGGVVMRGAWVDLPRLLAETRDWLGERWIRDSVLPEAMADDADGVRWQGLTAGRVVWCDGWRAGLPGRLWSDVPWEPAKGEALDLVSDAPAQDRVLNRDGWALPLGEGRWRTGTNWDWTARDESPTLAQREKLLDRFNGYFRSAPGTRVTGHVAGVRPCTRDNRPCLGRHPERPGHYLLNGLGPRGTVWAPTLVDHLEAMIDLGRQAPPELDFRRLLPR